MRYNHISQSAFQIFSINKVEISKKANKSREIRILFMYALGEAEDKLTKSFIMNS